MTSHFLAVRLTLIALLGSHITEIEKLCPAVITNPEARTDEVTKALQEQLDSEVQQMDKDEVRLRALRHLTISKWLQHSFYVQCRCLITVDLAVIPFIVPRLLQGAQVIFYGDSITEAWRGTDMGW